MYESGLKVAADRALWCRMGALYAYDYTPAARLRVTGEDSEDFLQSQFSNELRPFTSGQCTYGLWLDVKGKVLADAQVLCVEPEAFVVVSEWSAVEVIEGTLEHHIIADDVELEAQEALPALALWGAGVAEFLQQLGVAMPAAGSFTAAGDLWVYPGRRSLLPSVECLARSAAALARVRAALTACDAEFVSLARMQRERMDAGIPAVPAGARSRGFTG